ncbi:MAG: hypothetical protein LQ351_000531 [Letrouitia transgressa]|nr:MAG: hypothetical protein LQ351_000531 [Letrouitia transgressa]
MASSQTPNIIQPTASTANIQNPQVGMTGDRTQDDWFITSAKKLGRFYHSMDKKYGSLPDSSASSASQAFRSWSVQPNACFPIPELTIRKKSRFFPTTRDADASENGDREGVYGNSENAPRLPLINPVERTLREIDEDLDRVFGPSPHPSPIDVFKGPINRAQEDPAEESSSVRPNPIATNTLRYTQEGGIQPHQRSSDYGPLNAPAVAPQGFKSQAGAAWISTPPGIPSAELPAYPLHSRLNRMPGQLAQRPAPLAQQLEERSIPLQRKRTPAWTTTGTGFQGPQQSTAFPPSQPRATNVHPQANNLQLNRNSVEPVLKVVNLPDALGKHDLVQLFSQYGQIRWTFLQHEIKKHKNRRRYAKIGFFSWNDALLAQRNLDGRELLEGCKLQVFFTVSTDPAGPGDAPSGGAVPRQTGAAPIPGANMPEPRVPYGYFPQRDLVNAAMNTFNTAATQRIAPRPLNPHLTEKTGADSWRR